VSQLRGFYQPFLETSIRSCYKRFMYDSWTNQGSSVLAGWGSLPLCSVDACGVLNGDNSTCLDCAGIPNGESVEDACDLCGGDNSTCADCAGVPNGHAVEDACGVCDGDNSTCSHTSLCVDMNQDATDRYGDGCDWYVGRGFHQCGRWDDADFTATSLCCACGGGCNDNDNGALDSESNSCEYYTDNVDQCSLLDDQDFTAELMCCQCMGAAHATTSSPDTTTEAAPETSTSASSPITTCADTDFGATDTYGDDCSWYIGQSFDQCGRYDDADFTAVSMCCACGGGCADTNFGALDAGDKDCSWYALSDAHTLACGEYDDDDFSASEMCCACQGGCVDTTNGATDSYFDTCQWYEDHVSKCDDYNDQDFTASTMCCACNGGSVLPSSPDPEPEPPHDEVLTTTPAFAPSPSPVPATTSLPLFSFFPTTTAAPEPRTDGKVGVAVDRIGVIVVVGVIVVIVVFVLGKKRRRSAPMAAVLDSQYHDRSIDEIELEGLDADEISQGAVSPLAVSGDSLTDGPEIHVVHTLRL